MLDVTVTIEGLQAAQDANLRQIAALSPQGLGRTLQRATVEAHRLSLNQTPVDTGSWRASHRIDLAPGMGTVFIEPSATNSRTGNLVLGYAGEYEREGGSYAVYKNVAEQHGSRILQIAAADVVLSMEQA